MTDLLTLGLGLDTSQFASGAKRAADALDPVQSKLTTVSQSSLRFEGSLREVNKAASGTAQVTQGVGNLAKALNEGATSAAAFAAVGLGIEVSKTVDDFKDLTDAVSISGDAMKKTVIEYDALGIATTRVVQVQTAASVGIFQRLWIVLKANPLIAVAGALAAVGVAMSLFSTKTVEATDKFKEFLEETGKLRKREVTAENFPEQVQLQIARQKNTRLFDIATEIGTRGEPISLRRLSELTGYPESELGAGISQNDKYRYLRGPEKDVIVEDPRVLNNPFSPEARALREKAGYYYDDPGFFSRDRRGAPLSGENEFAVSADVAVQRLGAFYGTRDSQLAEREDKLRTKPDDVKAATKEAADAAREADQSMQSVLDKAEQLGMTFGDAWYQFVSGAQTGNELIKQLLASFVRSASQDAGGQLFRSIQGALSKTPSATTPTPTTPSDGGWNGGGGGGFGFGWGN